MDKKEITRRDRWLAALAALFAAVVVGFAMWPYRHRVATLSFWLQTFAIALGALGTFILLVAAWFKGLHALRPKANRGDETTAPPPAPAEDARTPPAVANTEVQAAPLAPVLVTDPRSLPDDLGARDVRWIRFKPSFPSIPSPPSPPSTFRGRDQELDELVAAVRERGVIICGPGGVGKTALALKLAQALAPDTPGTPRFIDLRGATSALAPGDVMRHIIRALDPGTAVPDSGSQLSGLYRATLHDRGAILVLDDAAGADQIEPLIPPPSCALLVTSRQPFQPPGTHALVLDTLGEEEARTLLRDMAPRIEEGGATNWAADLARLCGHLPLALKLAGGALAERADVAPGAYVSRLQEKRERLGPVTAALAVSHELLEEPLHKLWVRLGVFTTPFKQEDAAAVWEMEPDATHDTLDQLVRRGLVDWREEAERYKLHDLARGFAYQALQETEDPRPVHQLAAACLGERLSRETWNAPAEEVLEEVDQWERAEAWERFAKGASSLMGAALLDAGYLDAIGDRLKRALAAVEDGRLDNPLWEAILLGHLGLIAVGRGEWEHAVELHRRSLEIFERLGDAKRFAATSRNLAHVYADQGAWGQAIETYERSLKAFEGVDDPAVVALTQLDLATAYATRNRWDQAIDRYRQSLALYDRLGDLQGIAQVWDGLGRAYEGKEDWDQAIEAYVKELQTAAPMRDISRMARTSVRLSVIHARKGNEERATQMYEQSLMLYEHAGDELAPAGVAHLLGMTYADMGEWDQSIDYFRQSLEALERRGDLRGVAVTQSQLASLSLQKGEWDEAIEMYEQSLRHFARLGDLEGMASCRTNLALLHLERGRIEEAKPLLRQAYLVYAQLGSPDAARVHEALVAACGSREAANAYLAELFPKAD